MAMAKFIQLEEGITIHLRKEINENCFQIHTKTRDYFLCARDKEEMKLWIKNILVALKGPPVLKIAKEISVGSQIYSLALSRQLIWCSTAHATIKCFDVKNYTCVKEINLSDYLTIPSPLNFIPLVPTFDSVWIAVSNSMIRLNSNTFELISKPETSVQPNAVKHMVFIHDPALNQQEIWTSNGSTGVMEIWDTQTGKSTLYQAASDQTDEISCMISVGLSIYCGSKKGKVYVWSAKNQSMIKSFETKHTETITDLAHVWPNTIWTGSTDKTMCIYV
eukprot:TRINITY_DN2654_c0_g3_i1.p1 TRINITY_DN2654_c0_g3~~TRINITY_DN2654_c0_g3_i1.p1  ORF type:complete len:277 (-),score=38.10 TRINITY_DN2654_c0_g3_i1:272-1102(-)